MSGKFVCTLKAPGSVRNLMLSRNRGSIESRSNNCKSMISFFFFFSVLENDRFPLNCWQYWKFLI